MAERFDYPVTGAVTASFVPELDRDMGGSRETFDAGVIADQSAGLTEYRYAQGIRTLMHRMVYRKNNIADRAAFGAFYDAVGSQLFRFTDFLGLQHLCSFVPGPIERRNEEGNRWSWETVLREEDPPPGLERIPSALYPDLLFYLRARNNITAYYGGKFTPAFSRNSTATYIDAAAGSIMRTAAAGVPRFELAGLLMEGPATNLLVRSEEFDDVAWTKTNVTVSANGSIAPDQTISADKLIPNTQDAEHYVRVQPTVTASVRLSLSVFVKSAFYWISFRILNGAANAGAQAWFNIDTGFVGTLSTFGVGANLGAKIEKVGLGFYRLTLSAVIGASTSTIVDMFICNADGDQTFAGDDVDGVFFWGAQLEESGYSTSYIPTAGSIVARAAELLSVASTAALNSAGSLAIVNRLLGISNGVQQTLAALDDGNTANSHLCLIGSEDVRGQYIVTTGGISQADIVAGAGIDDYVVGQSKSMGITWSSNDAHLYTSGIERGNDFTASMPAVTTIRLGHFQDTVTSPFYGHLNDLAIFKRVLTAAEMASVHVGIIA